MMMVAQSSIAISIPQGITDAAANSAGAAPRSSAGG